MTMTITSRTHQRIVIIGGGISGLSAAWYLQKQAAITGLDLEYTVLEQSSRWGGKVLTEHVETEEDQPFVVEAGPDSFLTQKPWALQLAHELGLEDQLLGTNDHKRNTYVLSKGRPVVLPEGVMLIVPTKFMPFALSPLISPLGKLRMAMDLFIPAKTDDEDETLASFIKRRLGDEALDKIAEPLMSGIYNADADKQSIMATFPRFRALEKEHGSLTKGMLASRRNHPAPKPGIKKTSVFMSLNQGTNALIDALVPKLTGELWLNTQVIDIHSGVEGKYAITLDDGKRLIADAIIIATPAYVSADLVQKLAPNAAKTLRQIRYVSTGTISLAFKEADIPQPLNGFGLVVPSSENKPFNAITISSTKFDNRAPEGYVLMRAFFGGSRSPQSMHLDDAELYDTIRAELRTILGIEADPLFHRIYRWWDANPQYDIGHLDRVAAIEADLPDSVYVTGSPYRGVGMPDCVHQSQQTVEKLLANILERQVSQ
ncbi:MAG: protoporphyrinogen oxidase [Anaerolineaceae bacterium]|nr:protoporphyrinogen oxidase [Anaerolineaceae bacterium]